MPYLEEGRVTSLHHPILITSRKALIARRARSGPAPFEWLEPRQLLAANPNPVLAVSGNGLNIGFHDSSPRLQDGTDLGVLPTGDTSADTTFLITDTGGAALMLTDPTPVTFTGTNAADFSVGSLTTNTDGSMALVIHYAPAAQGTSNATVHIASNDPKHPDFTFNVRGTLAFTDYAIAMGTVKVPAGDVITDGRTTFTVPLKITNPGGLAVTGSASTTSIQIFLHDTVGGTDTPVATLANARLAGLGAVGSRNFNIKVTPPVGFSSGTYTFLAVVNGDGTIAESNPLTNMPGANNSASSVASITLAQAHVDITGALVSTTLPAATNDAAPVKGKITISVENIGNITLPANQKISIEVRAHSVSGDTVLGTFNNVPVGGLGAKARLITLNLNDTASLAAGTYQIEAFITPSPAISEDSVENNLLTQDASGNTFNVVSSAAFFNLTGTLGKSTLPATHAADTPLHGSLQVTVTNSSNVTLAANQQVVIDVFAGAFPLQVSHAFTLGALAPGASRTFTVPINVPAGVDAGNYILRAQIDSIPGLNETSFDDNIVTTDQNGQTISLTIT